MNGQTLWYIEAAHCLKIMRLASISRKVQAVRRGGTKNQDNSITNNFNSVVTIYSMQHLYGST